MESDDEGPGVVRSLAVTAEDLVAAVEARHQRGAPVVLRATPPFSGRMRARLHVPSDDGPEEGMVHVDPRALLDAEAPPYPRPGDTEDALRSRPTVTYNVERHHERHERAVAGWRRAVRDHFVDETVIETPAGERTVDVAVLGQ